MGAFGSVGGADGAGGAGGNSTDATLVAESCEADLFGCVAIQAKTPATKVNDTDTETRTAGQLIWVGSLEHSKGEARQGVKEQGGEGSGGDVDGTG
jgi:hypothetical protein